MTINDILDEIDSLQIKENKRAKIEEREPIDLRSIDCYTDDGEACSLITKIKFDGFNESILFEEFDAEIRKKEVIK